MTEYSSKQVKLADVNDRQFSASHSENNVWRTPNIMELDYRNTSNGTGSNDDGFSAFES